MDLIDFRKEINIVGAYDRRSDGHGLHGMEIRFHLIGPHGAVQFVVFTGIHLDHVMDEWWKMVPRKDFNPFKSMGADIGYHSPKPMYEGQEILREECTVIGGPCYYDGSGLAAREFMPEFIAGGDKAVWDRLEQEYRSTFLEDELEDVST